MKSDNTLFGSDGTETSSILALERLLDSVDFPFDAGARVGIKLHWGERGNHSFLPSVYAGKIAGCLRNSGFSPFVFDTTVLYSGGRRKASDSLITAHEHGYTPGYLGCPVVIADGDDGRSVVQIEGVDRHFETVEVTDLVEEPCGFVIFSHFKGHLAAGFGGAVKNLSMGMASRAQKQRMHADVRPVLNRKKCSRCGVCTNVCPTGAASMATDSYPEYDLNLCIGCAQCIAQCPEMALRVLWGSDRVIFQEKLVETAHAVWNKIASRSLLINALISITADCDCLPGPRELVCNDIGFVKGVHPVTIDAECIDLVGEGIIDRVHPGVPWRRQFEYADEIGFAPS